MGTPVYLVSYNQSMEDVAPTTYLTGCKINWEPYMMGAVDAVLNDRVIEKSIKGTVNEMNVQNIIEGDPVIIRSRVDSSQIWKGTMGTIDRESATSSNSSSSGYGMTDSSGDSQTTTSTYPFYVNLDSSDGLMLGQHVYIEMDEGQDTQKVGVWISEAYIVDADTDSPYVWATDKNDKLEKRNVILGQYDEELGEYEIADGLD